MIVVDVPMYWSRFQEDTVMNVQYLSLTQALLDLTKPCSMSFEWDMWQQEIPWMTLYFTVAVWVSILLTHAPNFTKPKKMKKIKFN